jgi:hypothetical protein
MKVEQWQWSQSKGWTPPLSATRDESAQLLLVFGAPTALQSAEIADALRKLSPQALVLGCSTAGEICGTNVADDSVVVTAVQFECSQVRAAHVSVSATAGSLQAGEQLGRSLPHIVQTDGGAGEKLTHVLVLSDGSSVNGSDLVRGMLNCLPADVTVTGGLAGDGARFGETLVFREGVPQSDVIAAVGLYGSRLKVGYGSMSGWDPFGPERLVTRSRGNILLELDGRPALSLYKQYLGEHAHGLPATGLLFPLSLRMKQGGPPLLRTILAVNEQEQSMTFAGDVPEGASARLTKANVERLIDGAAGAARTSLDGTGGLAPQLAILISCVGRKLVLKQRVEDEIDSVREVLGAGAALAGFYSYGEIAPFERGASSELHNQTMTISTFAET